MDKQFVWREVAKITADYPLMECDRCAKLIMLSCHDEKAGFF